LEKARIDFKIERSKDLNSVRINKMRSTNMLVETLQQDAKNALAEQIQDADVYKALLKDLLVQGLIKMIEPKMMLRVREEDVDLIKEVLPEAI
jgi:V-type H+-transporting ATPase subunit E